MKKGLIIGLTATAAAAAVSSLVAVGVSAGPLQQGSAARAAADDQAAQTLPAHAIAASLRAAGLDPNGEPVLRGRYYVLHAVDPHGTEMRVLADAQFGDILSVLPARRAGAYHAPYSGGARIIHVPQPDDAVAEGDYRDNAGADAAGVHDNRRRKLKHRRRSAVCARRRARAARPRASSATLSQARRPRRRMPTKLTRPRTKR